MAAKIAEMPPDPTTVMLLVDNALRQRLVRLLAPEGHLILESAPPDGSSGSIDLLVVDATTASGLLAKQWLSYKKPLPAVLAIGASSYIHEMLPGDASDEEIVRACRWLAERQRLLKRLQRETRRRKGWQRLAMIDPLTELPNRRAWDQRLKQPLERDQALAILDLDGFKQVNDQWGHPMGDQVLRSVGETLKHLLGPHGFIARIGGDEFGMLLRTETASPGAFTQVHAALTQRLVQQSLPPVTVSIGCALVATGETVAALLHRADQALRNAKSSGGNNSRIEA